MEASGTPTSPSTSSPVTPPPPAAPPSDKAGGGLRALSGLGALVLAFIAAVAIIVVFDIADTTPCNEVTSISQLNSDGECYGHSSTIKTVVLILGGIGSLLAVGSVLAALAFAIRGRGGRLLVQLIVGAAVFLGLSLIIG
jgi:hypothetical protein